jgi:hypothetical protein
MSDLEAMIGSSGEAGGQVREQSAANDNMELGEAESSGSKTKSRLEILHHIHDAEYTHNGTHWDIRRPWAFCSTAGIGAASIETDTIRVRVGRSSVIQ